MRACPHCGYVADGGKGWGYLDQPTPRYACDHADFKCRWCSSCSSWWHHAGMDEQSGEGKPLWVDCPDCEAFITVA